MQFYGRGGIGGVDIKSQKKEQGAFYGDLLERRRTDTEKEQEKERLKKVKRKKIIPEKTMPFFLTKTIVVFRKSEI